MQIRLVLLCFVWMMLAACEPRPDNTISGTPTLTPIPPTELPGQCDTTHSYELRLITVVAEDYPQDGIPSPRGNWISRTYPETLILTKMDTQLELTFSLPVEGGTRAEEHLLWSPDERWVALQYRFTLAKGASEYYLGVYGVNGSAYETLAVTLDSLPFTWTGTGLAFTRQPRRDVFTLMFWNTGRPSTLAENLSRPPFFAPDGTQAAIYTENRIETVNLNDANQVMWVEDVAGLVTRWANCCLKNAIDDRESLMLAFADGREPITLRTELSGLGNPLWSPDSQLLAFTQSINNQPVELHIVSVAGNDLWQFAHFPLEWTLGWFACD